MLLNYIKYLVGIIRINLNYLLKRKNQNETLKDVLDLYDKYLEV